MKSSRLLPGALAATAALLLPTTLLSRQTQAGIEVPAAAAKKPAKPAAAAPVKVEDPVAEADQSAAAAKLLGKTFDSLPVTSENGETLDLAKEKGWKVLYFWSPYCPCVRTCQSLSLFPVYKTYQQQKAPVSFYAVASNAGNLKVLKRPGVPNRVALNVPGGLGQSPPYPIVLDVQHKLADLLAAKTTPQTYVFDPENRLVFVGNPDDSEEIRVRTGRGDEMTKNYLADVLRDALANKKISRPLTPALGCDIDRSDVESVAQTPK